MKTRFDVIVIGGGHAGCEAAHVAARMGARTLLLTMNIDTIGHMSCNPAVGGLAKGNLVKEIDALGGIMGRVADASAIQYRQLNTRKGPAVRGSRTQNDMSLYRQRMQQLLMNQDGLSIRQGTVEDLCLDQSTGTRVTGVRTKLGVTYLADRVIMTTGTFLAGKCHVGLENFSAGRAGDRASVGLSQKLHSLNLDMGRHKTGTTPRLDARSIDWDGLEVQPGDTPPRRLSFYWDEPLLEQLPCYITYTNARTHEIIAAATDQSPLFTGAIEGVGPRYCPSIEDKVVRFADKERHQIFLEPQGLTTCEVYPNGLSTSLPLAVQYAFLRTIPGLERAEIMRAGYAVEYDFVNPVQLHPTMELRSLPGLYLAGQINGTSGYEEAAAQGMMAGINAARAVQGAPAVILGRDEAYIGVLIDDLVTKGTDEPYRMFTSRAEFRLLLREDNADLRLSQLGRDLGILGAEHYAGFVRKRQAVEDARALVEKTAVSTNDRNVARAAEIGIGPLHKSVNMDELLRRGNVTVAMLAQLVGGVIADSLMALGPAEAEQVEIQARYAPYIERQLEQVRRFREMEDVPLPVDFDYDGVHGLSYECRQRLTKASPVTIGQAARVPGVTPAAVSAISVQLHSTSTVTRS
jgi:tRNA uridine 5-carboxymethylaminomethyl modification enzyme